MDRHWTLDLVALSGVCAGFALAATGNSPLAGVVAAGSAYAVLVPELAGDRTRATTSPTVDSRPHSESAQNVS